MGGKMESILVRSLLCLSFCLCVSSDFLNQFSVKFDGERQQLEEVAKSMGFKVEHEFKHMKVFLLTHSEVDHRSKRSAVRHVDRLNAHPKVLYAQQEELLDRQKRGYVHDIVYDKQLELPIRDIKDNSVYHRVKEARLSARSENSENVVQFLDPMFQDQWSLRNYGQTDGKIGMDLNVDPAWQKGFSGKDVVVCILDDGIDHTHADLSANYDSLASTDLNDLNDEDPMPDMSKSETENNHGTRCAGEIAAAAQNGVCGVGVAFNARIGGVRILDGNVTDLLEAAALTFNMHYIQIISASWGPRDNGRCMEGPKKLAADALKRGVKEGRNGLGTIYVWATGNGGLYEDDCSADGYVSSIETLSIGSVNDRGMKPYFMEQCTSTLAVVPSGGEEEKGEESEMGITKIKVVTTDVNNGCIENFQGTSASAPLATACVALALEANPNLTWRDVQHIVVHSSRIPSVDHSWRMNGAGLHISHKFGFGLIDCSRMVELAQTWMSVPEQNKCALKKMKVNKQITSSGTVVDEVLVGECKGESKRIHFLEHVQVKIKMSHSRRGDVQIFLVSPSNTWSQILSPRPLDNSGEGIDFTFMTVHCWAENPEGVWSLRVTDVPGDSNRVNTGELLEWTLILYGTAGSRVGRMDPHVKATGEAHFPTLIEVRSIMDEEDKRTNQAKISPAGIPVVKKKNLEIAKTNSKLVEDLLKALKNSPQSNSFKRKQELDVSSKRHEFLRRLDNLHEEKKSSNLKTQSNNRLEDDVLDVLVDAVTKELKLEEEAQKRKEEEQRRRNEEEQKKRTEEHELDELVNRLKKKLLSEDHVQKLSQQRTWPSGVSKEKKEEELLQELLSVVKKDIGHDKEKMHQVEEEISSRQETSEKKMLEEVRKALEEEGKSGSKRQEGAGILKSVRREELSVRTLTDLLNYLKGEK